jgi:beta-glucanase (GH16 family)
VFIAFAAILLSLDFTVGVNHMATWTSNFTSPAGSPPDAVSWSAVQGSGVAPEGGGNGELETYAPEALAMDGDGNLVITATANSDGTYTSGKIWTIGKVDFLYGHIAVRAAFPDAGKPGYWPGIWLLGEDYPSVGWPVTGEIDMAELFGVNGLNNQVSSSVHTTTDNNTAAYTFPAGQNATTFHVYSLDWRPTSLTFSVDGVPFETVYKSQLTTWPFDKPFFIILNLAIGGTQGGTPVPADMPYTMKVNYVTVSGSMVGS